MKRWVFARAEAFAHQKKKNSFNILLLTEKKQMQYISKRVVCF